MKQSTQNTRRKFITNHAAHYAKVIEEYLPPLAMTPHPDGDGCRIVAADKAMILPEKMHRPETRLDGCFPGENPQKNHNCINLINNANCSIEKANDSIFANMRCRAPIPAHQGSTTTIS